MSAATDFDPGPETFTTPATKAFVLKTSVGSVRTKALVAGEKNNGSGDAIASMFTRGGTPQR